MAQLILSTLGESLGARLPGVFSTIGASLGRAAGNLIGGAIDQRLFGTTAHYEGARLTDLHIQTSTEGASIPAVYGRVRIAGQVIWAARFKENRETHHVGGGKGGAPRATNTNYTYSLSFAVGLCEGPISRIGRVWANGEPFDLSQVSWRLHRGDEGEDVDPLIEAIEGAGNAPGYRGLAYIVFEDLPLENFGNTIPQLSFEIVRPAPALPGEVRFEERVKGVCLIPGSGEFVYATEPIFRSIGPGQQSAENVQAERNRANFQVSLDQLAADFPNCESVLLVVSWFGGDLRCGSCQIKPGVEIAEKDTTPLTWFAGGLAREHAHLISQFEGAPAYGGTPSDASVLQAITELRARGYKVGLYPFVLMDVPAGNALPDPYGGAAQAAYPWRGRITLHPALGEASTPDKTSAATTQIAAFVGTASASDFGESDGAPTYGGPDEWSFRRFILHYAKLAEIAGVDAFLLGSELRGMTTVRDGATSFPFVAGLQDLAADVRGMLGGDVTLTYAADWSEYRGCQPQDGTGDVLFHLDPLWADTNIDVVGIDWYAPLTDWREGQTHLDAELAHDIHDAAYLEGRIEAGEDFEWYYASNADRTAQTRTAISDGAHSEPWVFRAKDLRSFWFNAHHDRPGGVRASSPTAWTPESKPIWLIELGCPAVDKGSNAPNLFSDAKSSESALPPFSTGARDDLIQRRALDAYLRHWALDAPTNPISSVDARRMIDASFLWCWDARPNPAFPARTDVWTDGASWRLGHWLNGRAGLSELSEVVADLCRRAGVSDAEVDALKGAVSGFIVDSPATARAGLEPLMAVYGFAACEHDGGLAFFHRHADAEISVEIGDLAAANAADMVAQRADSADKPIEARVRFLDPARDYLLAEVSARRLDRAQGGAETVDAPLVLEVEAAEALAQGILADRRAAVETLQIDLGPAHIALESGDCLTFAGGADAFEIVRIADAETRSLQLRRARSAPMQPSLAEPNAPTAPLIAPTPAISILDLPPLPGFEDDDRPLSAVFASPWLGTHEIDAGASRELATRRASITQPAVMGELAWALWPGPVDRWDDGNVFRITLYTGALASVTADAALNGANVFAIEAGDDEWEVIQARNCVLVAPNTYELSGLLRGQLGSAHAIQAPHSVGARVMRLDATLPRLDMQAHEWGEPLRIFAPPQGATAADPRTAQLIVTLPHAALRAWAPAHLRAKRSSSGDVVISWIRCARIGGDAWGAGDPPLGATSEAYLLEILDGGGAVVRSVSTASATYAYAIVDQTADFGVLPGSLRLRLAQVMDGGATGLNKELTITL